MAIFSKKDIVSERREMEQYLGIGSFDDDSDNYSQLLKISPYVGEAMMAFSNLEHSVELAIAGLVSDRSDESGVFLLKFLHDNSDKIDYLSEAGRQHIIYTDSVSEKMRPKLLAELKKLGSSLRDIAEIRNIIAHSKWNTMTKKSFVVNSTKLNKSTGRVEIVLYKLNPRTLQGIITGINTVNDDVWKFIDKANLR